MSGHSDAVLSRQTTWCADVPSLIITPTYRSFRISDRATQNSPLTGHRWLITLLIVLTPPIPVTHLDHTADGISLKSNGLAMTDVSGSERPPRISFETVRLLLADERVDPSRNNLVLETRQICISI